jgi:hypothetical protein
MTTTQDTRTLAQLILAGLAAELDYMTTDQQAENLDRYEFLRSCDQDELADAADFIATAMTPADWSAAEPAISAAEQARIAARWGNPNR